MTGNLFYIALSDLSILILRLFYASHACLGQIPQLSLLVVFLLGFRLIYNLEKLLQNLVLLFKNRVCLFCCFCGF